MSDQVYKYYFCMYDDSIDTKWSVQPRKFVVDTTEIFTCKFLQDNWFNYSVSGVNYQEKLGDIHFMVVKSSKTQNEVMDDLNRHNNLFPSRNDIPVNTAIEYYYFKLERCIINNFCKNISELKKDQTKFTMIDKEIPKCCLSIVFVHYKELTQINITLPSFTMN